MSHPPPQRAAPSGRVSVLLLCIVILALLVPGVLSYVRARGGQPADGTTRTVRPPGDRSATTSRVATPPPPPSAPERPDRSSASPTPVRPRSGVARRVTAGRAGAPTVPGTRVLTPATVPPTTPPASTADAAPPAPAPAVTARPASTAPADFVVLSAGDEELAPVSLTATSDGQLLPLYEVGSLLGAVVTEEQGTIRIELHADEPVVTALSAWTLRGTRSLRGRDSAIVIPQGQLQKRDDRWYVSPDALHALTGLDFAFDTRSQSLVITSPRSQIPRFAASVRRAQRSALLARAAADFSLSARPAAGARVAGSGWAPDMAALTYGLSQDNATGRWSAQGTLGAAVLGGGLSVSGTVGSAGSPRSTSDISWLGGNPLSRWLTQARVGYGAATGLAPLPGTGVSITNAPFSRPIALGSVPMSGTAVPGSEIEIQSGGRLLGLVTADANGQWQAPVPVGFGQNLLEISAYGPQGVTRRTALLSLDGDHLAGGRVEYGVTAQRSRPDAVTCALSGCGDMGNVDLRWGVTPRLTVRVGGSGIARFDSGGVTGAVYGGVVAAPTPWLQLRQDAADGGWWRSRVTVQPSLAFRADVAHERLGSESASPFWLARRAETTRSETWGSVTWRPVPGDLGRLWLSALGRDVLGHRANTTQATFVAGARLGQALITLGGEHTTVSPVGLPEATTFARVYGQVTLPQLRMGPRWLASSFTTIGTESSTQQPGQQNWVAGLTTTLFNSLLVQVATDWRPGTTPGVRLQLQQQGRNAIVMQSVGRAAGADQQVVGSTSVLGSLLMPVDGRAPTATSDLVALRSRVRVLAFFDADNNGLYDPDEATVPDLTVIVGTSRTTTNDDGVALVSGLPVLDALPVRAETDVVTGRDGETWIAGGLAPWARLVPYGETVVLLPFSPAASATVHIDASISDGVIWITPLDASIPPPPPVWPFPDGRAVIGPLRPGRYRLEGRRAPDARSAPPWGRCTIALSPRAASAVTMPLGATSPGDPACPTLPGSAP